MKPTKGALGDSVTPIEYNGVVRVYKDELMSDDVELEMGFTLTPEAFRKFRHSVTLLLKELGGNPDVDGRLHWE